jgi:drug/metabolite transporter (DMT)-like permease
MNASQPSGWQIAMVLAVGVASASTAAIFVRLALDAAAAQGIGFSLVLAASRLILASLFLLPAWRTLRPIEFQRLAPWYSAIAGVFLALHFATWITSLSFTSIAASTTLVATNPIWVALLSWLWFKEKPGALTVVGIGITLIGGVLVAIGSGSNAPGSSPLLGNSLALAGAWAVSLYFLLGREAQRCGVGISSHVVITYSTAAVVLLPLPWLFGAGYSGYPSQVYLYILLMALFPQLVGHTSFNWAVRWISPTLVTLAILMEPVGSSILGAILFQENPGLPVILGAAVILSGVAIAALGNRPHPLSSSD